MGRIAAKLGMPDVTAGGSARRYRPAVDGGYRSALELDEIEALVKTFAVIIPKLP
jgi:hypothetical protein